MKKRCKLKRKTTRIAGTERENFKDVKEMESSKNDQKSEKEEKKNAIIKTFDDEKVMKIENCRKLNNENGKRWKIKEKRKT